MHTTTLRIIEQIGELGYGVAIARDHFEADSVEGVLQATVTFSEPIDSPVPVALQTSSSRELVRVSL